MSVPRLLVGLLAGCALFSTPATAQAGYISVANNGWLFDIDPVTGAELGILDQIFGVSEINAMARRPSDGVLFFSNGWVGGSGPLALHKVTLSSSGTILNHFVVPLTGPPQIGIGGMAFDSNDELYATNYGMFGGELIKIDTNSGVCTPVGNGLGIPGPPLYTGMAWDEANGHFVAWHRGSATNPPGAGTGAGLVHIDRASGLGTDPDPLQQATDYYEVQGLGFDRDGRLISVGWFWLMQELDPASGAVLWSSPVLINRALRGIEDIRPRTLQMTLGGSCPGQMTVELSSGTPGAQAAIAYSFGNAGFTVPNGPCAGTVVQLSAPATLLGVYPLDGQGAYTLGPMNVPATACGNVWVQAIDLANCAQTAVRQP